MHPGSLGAFQIHRELGRGGMGEVYLATDTRLDRRVAIKALPAHVSQDPDRLSRFQREAKVLASLNHPGIGAIYGLEEASGRQYLILEFVEGETLAARLKRGPIPIDEALPIARRIAEALEAAHEKGVIHRDLKPGNVMVSPTGAVKVLDFGLARTGDVAPSGAFASDGSASPTVTTPAPLHSPTIPGVIMGTAGYMSPEQARGKPVDKRSDIFSFGCVLYELLTGALPFDGETVADAIGATLHKEPDLARLPSDTPPIIRGLLARCLAKDRENRLHDIADARLDIVQAMHEPRGSGAAVASASAQRQPRGVGAFLPWAIAAIAVLGGSWLSLSARLGSPHGNASASGPVVRFTIDPPPGYAIPEFIDNGSGIAIDPAGERIVFAAKRDGKNCLCVRPFASGQSRVLPGTTGCRTPFFSPDGKWLGFVSGQQLMKMPSEGGPALTLTEASDESTYAWLDDGTIVWGAGTAGLWRVSAAGGKPSQIATCGPDVKTLEGDVVILGFDAIVAVPGASYCLLTTWSGGSTEDFNLLRFDLADGSLHTVLRAATAPALLTPERLIFARGPTVMTVGFDRERGVVVGDPTVALEGVRTDLWTDSAYFGASTSGTFAYVPGGRRVAGRQLMRVDETGASTPLADGTDFYSFPPVVSPDGTRVLFTTLRSRVEVWTADLERHSRMLVTSSGENHAPTWSSDGRSIFTLFAQPDKPLSIVRWPVGGGEPESLAGSCPNNEENFPLQALPDGSGLLVLRRPHSAINTSDIALYRFSDASFTSVRDRGANEKKCRVSPDGKWIAFTSDESGRDEVYLGPLGAKEPNVQVSTIGGTHPHFSRDGKQVFYVDAEQNIMAVALDTTGADVRLKSPVKLFNCATVGAVVADWATFDVLPDGGFVMIRMADWEKEAPVIHVIMNWSVELAGREPAATQR
ncbi:MAG: protein kinase [Phycisphaerales bacterium]